MCPNNMSTKTADEILENCNHRLEIQNMTAINCRAFLYQRSLEVTTTSLIIITHVHLLPPVANNTARDHHGG